MVEAFKVNSLLSNSKPTSYWKLINCQNNETKMKQYVPNIWQQSLIFAIYSYYYNNNLTKLLQYFMMYDIVLDPCIYIFQVSEDGLRHEN